MLVHIQTITQSQFAWVSEDGNITETRTISAAIPTLTQEAFDQAFVGLCAAREQLKQEFQEGSG